MAAPTCGSRRSQLMFLSGDRGARRLLEAADPDLRLVATSDSGILRDIDTPSDLVEFDVALSPAGEGVAKAPLSPGEKIKPEI